METVFITIHDLTRDARIRFCSESIEDVLGYKPREVVGKACWEYFHPDELPFARNVHRRSLTLDKAASFNYARVKHKNGEWRCCECVFTVVFDCLVASTAIYQRGPRSQRRAVESSNVRRIFSSSPRDPRYHMLSFISNKFTQPAQSHYREPRAAMVLNRFTRTHPIMYVTPGVEKVIGLKADQLLNKSFYYCIEENCMSQAIRTLESAKGNDSIAYLRFWYRDPTQSHAGVDEHINSVKSDTEASDVEGGVDLQESVAVANEMSQHHSTNRPPTPPQITEVVPDPASNNDGDEQTPRSSSNHSTDTDDRSVFDPPLRHSSSRSSLEASRTPPDNRIELEAVVSCTSDGLLLILRRALPMIPRNATSEQPTYPNGLFASPWAERPMLPDNLQRATSIPKIAYPPSCDPTEAGLMAAIRDVAVFAWSLTGINGSLIEHAAGTPQDEALPPGGLPIWDPNVPQGQNDQHNGYSGSTHRKIRSVEIAAAETIMNESTSGEDEVVWKRVPKIPPIRRPKRRRESSETTSFDDTTDVTSSTGRRSKRRTYGSSVEG